MLHVTNGDCAIERLRAAGIEGDMLSWLDVLHDGPVPADHDLDALRPLRARFIASRGWTSLEDATRALETRDLALTCFRDHEEVVLWFEHDLFDQLQLLQLLDWFADRPLGRTRLTQVASDTYLGEMREDEVRRRHEARTAVEPAQLALGREAWRAFGSTDPRAVESLVARGDAACAPLPFVRAALRRHLQELPDARTGLSRTERQALEALAAGPAPLGDVYRRAHHEREEAIYLGDASFFAYVEALSPDESPLVTTDDGAPVRVRDAEHASLVSRTLALTEDGRAVLAGHADRVALCGIDRWLGGVHLFGHQVPWRWDGERVVRV